MLVAPKQQCALAWAVPIASEASAFGRSLLIAWVIGPAELGQAMMLALTLRLVEMATDIGFERLIVQAHDGDAPNFQSELHAVSVMRGGFAACILLLLAPLLAVLFDSGPELSTYAVLALAPFLRGFAHLDYRRAERNFLYLRTALVELGASGAMLLAILPALWLFADHRAMAAVLIAQCGAFAFLSHVVAQRSYRLVLSTHMMLRCWSFGAPLILNALLLFATFYADRVLVAAAYDWQVLALYGVALQLALLPAQIVGRAAASLVLPALRMAIGRPIFEQVWHRILWVHALLCAAMLIGFTAAAPTLISALYGDAFRLDPMLALALASAAGFRILRTPFSQLAVATGRTGDPARANLWRALALGPAIICAALGLPLLAIAGCAALGEFAATLRAIGLSKPPRQNLNKQEVFA